MATLTTTETRTAAAAVREIAGDPSHPIEALSHIATNDVFIIPIGGDGATAVTTSLKGSMRAPFAFTVTSVQASVFTASSSGTPTFDINKNGTTILPTKLTIDANEKTSRTAATAAVLSTTAGEIDFALDDELSVDVDTAGTSTTGARVYVYYQRTA